AHSLLTQTFSFLFRSSRDHRALPSFPTRRSSDLPKQLLAFEGKSLLKRITDEALAVSDHPVTVVWGAYHETIAKELSGSKAMIVVNPKWKSGMSGSIQSGLNSLLTAHPDLDRCIITVCDQPFVDATVLMGLGILAD